jgi:outer membrane protein OmpA-like peptidoglycan-associated protein
MRRHDVIVALLALLVFDAVAALAQAHYADAWDPAAVAAAEAAVARLGAHRALDVRATVLTIPGLQLGVQGATRSIVATVQELQAAKRDLGAQETELEVKVELPADVLFDFDRADIRSDAAAALGKLATIIAAYPGGRVELGGHTDSKGADDYNLRLSQQRAESVKAWLVSRHGLDAARIATRGWGETRPVADNATDAGRQKNRRVEAVIRKQPG